ncbi:MAG: MBL fold metallo-hydrolase [Thiobacillus sp.]
MKEILPGVFHWKTFHKGIQAYVHSCYINATDPPLLIDPRVPKQGIEWFASHGAPRHAYLTNRHHYRHSGRFAARYGAEVWCHKDGLHEFTQGEKVRGFNHGKELPGGILALKVAALCPEETAFFVPLHGGILSLGDAIVRERGRLSLVPDAYMGDDPDGVKRGLRTIFSKHLHERTFDHLLFAHGAPWIGGARAGLETFLAALERQGY